LWLNDDSVLFENALKLLLESAKATDNKSIIVGSTCDETTNEITYSGFNVDGKIVSPTSKLEVVNTFNGNCVLIPRYVFQKVGLIDSLFHHAIGDIDYGLRAVKIGIQSYIAPEFIAYCESHKHNPDWCRKEIPFLKRVKSLYSPLGNSHPYYYFRFELRHYGLYIAFKHLFTIHLRLIYPGLWK
jgi:GT2 family glycosyltransferase